MVYGAENLIEYVQMSMVLKLAAIRKNPLGLNLISPLLGDSFTEAVGMAYEDSFVDMFANRFNELKIANFWCFGILTKCLPH